MTVQPGLTIIRGNPVFDVDLNASHQKVNTVEQINAREYDGGGEGGIVGGRVCLWNAELARNILIGALSDVIEYIRQLVHNTSTHIRPSQDKASCILVCKPGRSCSNVERLGPGRERYGMYTGNELFPDVARGEISQ